MSEVIRKEHNVSALMYHIVCPAKYRRAVINEVVDKKLREVCLGIEARYEIGFLEIGTELDHVHFLVQSVPTYSPEQIVRTINNRRALPCGYLFSCRKPPIICSQETGGGTPGAASCTC
jgi:REP element-mobilizing transposase RayT